MNWWLDSYDSIQPMRGAFTNFTIWDRALTEADIKNWSKCSLNIIGNILSWDDVSLGIVLKKLIEIIYLILRTNWTAGS